MASSATLRSGLVSVLKGLEGAREGGWVTLEAGGCGDGSAPTPPLKPYLRPALGVWLGNELDKTIPQINKTKCNLLKAAGDDGLFPGSIPFLYFMIICVTFN